MAEHLSVCKITRCASWTEWKTKPDCHLDRCRHFWQRQGSSQQVRDQKDEPQHKKSNGLYDKCIITGTVNTKCWKHFLSGQESTRRSTLTTSTSHSTGLSSRSKCLEAVQGGLGMQFPCIVTVLFSDDAALESPSFL